MYTAASTLLLAASLVPSGVSAMKSVLTTAPLNDWTRPCINGRCAFTSGDGKGTAFHSLLISGSSAAVSDLTEAAGWQIDGCPADWSDGQITVQITCAGDDANCNAVFEVDAADTIVRLPEGCGTGPFARIVSVASSSKFRRQNGASHSVVLDYQFDQITHDRGEVDFAVSTSNVEEISNSLLAQHSLLSQFTGGPSNHTGLVSRWESSKTFNIPPLKVDKDFNLFKTSVDCPAPASGGAGFSADISVDTSVHVDAQVAFGFTVGGKIFPPKLTKVQSIGSLNGEAGADFTVTAHAKGTFDTGSVSIWDAGLPGLSIPGIISVGPSFGIHGQLTADVGLEAEVKTGVHWQFPQLHMAFPQDSGDQTVQADPVTHPFQLSLAPSLQATGNVHAALIPRIDLGVKVLAGIASATIFLDVEASADLGLNLNGTASVGNFDASGQANGCATLKAGVVVNAGAQGHISGIFDKDIEYPLFTKNVDVFNQCFTAATPAPAPARREETPARRIRRATSSLERRAMLASRDITCPDLSLGALAQVLNL